MNIIDFFGNVIKPVKMKGTGCFNPHETGWVNERIAAVLQLDVNVWIIKCGKTFIAFDAGYVDHPLSKQDFEELGIDSSAISHCFLTHGDMDHDRTRYSGLIGINLSVGATRYFSEALT